MTFDLAARLWSDDEGQDLIEYALLVATVALASVAAFDAIRAAIGAAYRAWGSGIDGLWETPPPQ
jgi:Flp pilus assembly pilin Flp